MDGACNLSAIRLFHRPISLLLLDCYRLYFYLWNIAHSWMHSETTYSWHSLHQSPAPILHRLTLDQIPLIVYPLFDDNNKNKYISNAISRDIEGIAHIHLSYDPSSNTSIVHTVQPSSSRTRLSDSEWPTQSTLGFLSFSLPNNERD